MRHGFILFISVNISYWLFFRHGIADLSFQDHTGNLHFKQIFLIKFLINKKGCSCHTRNKHKVISCMFFCVVEREWFTTKYTKIHKVAYISLILFCLIEKVTNHLTHQLGQQARWLAKHNHHDRPFVWMQYNNKLFFLNWKDLQGWTVAKWWSV